MPECRRGNSADQLARNRRAIMHFRSDCSRRKLAAADTILRLQQDAKQRMVRPLPVPIGVGLCAVPVVQLRHAENAVCGGERRLHRHNREKQQ